MRYIEVLALVASVLASLATACSVFKAPEPAPTEVSITVNGPVNAPISVLVAPR
jgi:hypothetical protein